MISGNDSLLTSILRFVDWLDRYGPLSYDYQTYYAGSLGRKAKRLHYDHPPLGSLAVLPMVFCEAFLPSAKCLFWKRQRFPIADAHFAMGFLFLAELTGEEQYYSRALRFLNALEQTRSAGYDNYCWGYPFDWETMAGTVGAGTPLITTVPYVYEAFKQAYQLDRNNRWLRIMESIAEHVCNDYNDVPVSSVASTCSYTPNAKRAPAVVNANAYRAFLLTSAALDLSKDSYRAVAQRNLQFVLSCQNADGSWYYGKDEQRIQFTDHYHTCFVLKALAKIESLTGDANCTEAIDRGIRYYVANLFDDRRLPKPFSRRPRVIVYRRELYDYAECVNLATLLRGRSSQLDAILDAVLDEITTVWQKSDGCFRARQLHLGWDTSIMHRWGQSQMFRSLCFLLHKSTDASGHSVPETMADACCSNSQ